MTQFIETFIEQAHQAQTVDALGQKFQHTLSRLGFDHWAYQLIAPAHDQNTKPRILSNYPTQWVDRYIQKGYHRIDPVVINGSSLVLPFTWHEMARKHATTPLKTQFFAEAKDAGLPNGFGLSMRGGNHAHALISASTTQTHRDLLHTFKDRGRILHLASLVFHNVAKDLLSLEKLKSKHVDLTPRERECLIWAMKGKSAWDIGTILNISEPCVRFHFTNIREKLDVTTIREAVVKSYMHGLISL